MTAAPLLVAESIGKTFGTRRVLNSASLWVRSGVITVVVGRNGEGKSTLLKIAAGVLRPDFGTVRYREEHFGRARLANLASKGVFFLPEHPLLCTSFTVRDHLMMIQRRFVVVVLPTPPSSRSKSVHCWIAFLNPCRSESGDARTLRLRWPDGLIAC